MYHLLTVIHILVASYITQVIVLNISKKNRIKPRQGTVYQDVEEEKKQKGEMSKKFDCGIHACIHYKRTCTREQTYRSAQVHRRRT